MVAVGYSKSTVVSVTEFGAIKYSTAAIAAVLSALAVPESVKQPSEAFLLDLKIHIGVSRG